MKLKLTARESNRINHINFLMNDIHGSVNSIYENLVDNDNEALKTDVTLLIHKLKQLLADAKEEV
jgi:hypothetical protein